jgi:1-acyl-sn-glycerol-3-phosphate acyltransferase
MGPEVAKTWLTYLCAIGVFDFGAQMETVVHRAVGGALSSWRRIEQLAAHCRGQNLSVSGRMKQASEIVNRTATSQAPAADTPSPSIWTRLLFVWFALVAVAATIVFSTAQLITHQFAPTVRNFKRWAGRWGRVVLGGAGIRVDVEQRAPLDPDQPYVFVSNHQNLLDILVLADALPLPFGFVAKIELARVPFIGWTLKNSACLFIDRSDPRRSLASLQAAGERIRAGTSVLLFAEGSRSYGPSLLPLKKGAFAVAVEAGVPLVPVTITNAYRLMDERRKTVRPGRIQVIVGEPISMAGRHRRDIPQIMEVVRGRMETELALHSRTG